MVRVEAKAYERVRTLNFSASVAVDFHANADLNNFRRFPSHQFIPPFNDDFNIMPSTYVVVPIRAGSSFGT